MAEQFYPGESDCKECSKGRASRWQQSNLDRARATRRAAGQAYRGRLMESDPDGFRRERAEASRRTSAVIQAETVETARRNGYQWTGPELELAARTDLTAREVAKMLGRTLRAVEKARHKLKHDPKTRNHAGVPSA